MILEIVLISILCLVIFFVAVMVRDGNRFVIKEYYFMAPKLKNNAKFVLLADLHNKAYGRDNEKLVNAIDKISPNYILIAGDMLTAAKGADYDKAVLLLSGLAAKYPIYYGNGNHEHRITNSPSRYGSLAGDYELELKKNKIERLLNQHVCLPELNVTVYGLDIDRSYYKKMSKSKPEPEYLDEIIGKPSRDSVNILIAHNPEYFEEYARWGADLVVSGHVHGGIMKLPGLGGVISPRLRLFPKYDGGIFLEGKSTMILSRGLGSHTLPVRIFNPGELVVIHARH